MIFSSNTSLCLFNWYLKFYCKKKNKNLTYRIIIISLYKKAIFISVIAYKKAYVTIFNHLKLLKIQKSKIFIF